MPNSPSVRVDSLAPEVAERLACVFQSNRRVQPGDTLPPLWHWAYFAATEPMDALGPDGHPRRDDEWVQRYPRRMAGGGSVVWQSSLVVGIPAERHSNLASARERRGRSGDLVICDWHHSFVQEGRTVLEEVQTVLYRAAPSVDGVSPAMKESGPGEIRRGDDPAASAKNATDSCQEPWVLARQVDFGPVLLFRFSAATWNSHRIHYDTPYATGVEGYPGLLVHGPLLTMLLAQEAERVLGRLASVKFRSHGPVFDVDTVDVYVQRSSARACRAEARRTDGTVATSLFATAGEQ
jgi:hydroxyacyl-ACP dehydratase HTD2-like protein with hotdog domain